MSLGDVVAMLRRRVALIVSLTVLGTVLAGAIAWTTAPTYEAISTVLIDPRKKTIVKDAEVVSELPADTPSVESEVEILNSKSTLGRVIELLDLRHDPEFNTETTTSKLLRWIGLRKHRPVDGPQLPHNHSDSVLMGDPERDEVLDVFAKHVKVQRRRNTYLIEVIATARDPVLAARISNAVVDSYLKLQLQTKTRATGVASDWLEQKLEGLRGRVLEAERAVAQFKSENGLIDTENGQRLEDKQLARLLEQTIVARTQVAESRAKFQQVQKLMSTPGAKGAAADVLESQTIRTLKDQLVRVTRREAELETRYGPRHPEMLKIKAESRDIERQVETEVDQILSNYKSAYEVAEARERSLTDQLEQLKSSQTVTNNSGVRLRDLEREATATRSIYESFLARYKQTAEQQSMQQTDARLVEAATVPMAPAAPKKPKILAMGFAGGLGLALALALLLEMMQPGLARPEEVERATGLPCLASVPELTIDRTTPGRSRLNANRMVLAAPEGPFAESVRAMRHAVDMRWRSGQGRMVLLASALPGEGKSALASNLALHYSTTGERVLLIDGDLRRATLSKTSLPGPAELGLFDCLARRMPIERAILRDTSTGLCFLPAHGAAPPPASIPTMLAAPAFGGVLQRLRQQFDVIIIDSPPILPVVDARILAEYVDQILFVMKWRSTAKEMAQRALRMTAGNARKFTGVLINHVPQAELGEAYGYGPVAYRAGRRRPTKPQRIGGPSFARGGNGPGQPMLGSVR